MFLDIMVLANLSYDSGKNEVTFVKIGTMVLDLQLVASFPEGFQSNLP